MTTNTTDDAARKAFEEICYDHHIQVETEADLELVTLPSGKQLYKLGGVDVCWRFWQAALQYAAKMRAQEEPAAYAFEYLPDEKVFKIGGWRSPDGTNWTQIDPPSEPDNGQS